MKPENRLILIKLLVVTVAMFGFGYGLVPMYKKICEVTGLNQIALADEAPVNTQVDRQRTVTMEFDANIRTDLPWTFRPSQTSVKVHPGELVQVSYEVRNHSADTITGQAIASYGPLLAAAYVKKMECFCFKTQEFKPGEVRQMPVVFVLDPKLPSDVNTVTLSYTFFRIEGGQKVERIGAKG
jgi:cytochrome c oxidase assembly protein subunit 11